MASCYHIPIFATEPEAATPAQPEGAWLEPRTHKLLKNMVAVEGLEPPARGL